MKMVDLVLEELQLEEKFDVLVPIDQRRRIGDGVGVAACYSVLHEKLVYVGTSVCGN